MKILGAVKENPVSWFILLAMYLALCWAMYQDWRLSLPWYYIVLMWIVGAIVGPVIIAFVISPLFQFLDFGWRSFFGFLKRKISW